MKKIDEELELRLLSGTPIPLNALGNIYLPTIKEIAQIGLHTYRQMLSVILFDKYKFVKGMKDEISDADKETVLQNGNLEVLLSISYADLSFRYLLLSALKFFFRENFTYESDEAGNSALFLCRNDENHYVTEDMFDTFVEIIKTANFISDTEDDEDSFNPANEQAKKLWEMMQRNKKKKPPIVEKVSLNSMISAMRWKSGESEKILDCTVYQLYDGYARLIVLDDYHFTLTGLYTGNVDGKKINMKEIHWANKLKNN